LLSIPLFAFFLIYFNPVSLIAGIVRLSFWLVYTWIITPALLFSFKKNHSEAEQWGMVGVILTYVIATLIGLGLESLSYFVHGPTASFLQGFLAIWFAIALISNRGQK